MKQNVGLVLLPVSHIKPDDLQSQLPQQNISPRKCRDIFCIIFFIAWISFVLIVFFTNKKFHTSLDSLTVIVNPADINRRNCGDKTQLDAYATDFSTILKSFDQIKSFCKAYTVAAGSSFDCRKLIVNNQFNTTESRILIQEARSWNNDQITTKAFQTLSGYVCVIKAQQCIPPTGTQYLCSQEFPLLVKVINGEDITKVFFTKTELDTIIQKAVSLDLGNQFIQNMCQRLASDYVDVTVFKPLGIEYCGINYIKTLKENQVIGGLSTYIYNFFSQVIGQFIIEINSQWQNIVYSICFSVVVMIFYLVFLRFFVLFIVIVTIIGSFTGLAYVLYVFFSNYKQIKDQFMLQELAFGIFNQSLQNQYKGFLAGGIIVAVVTGILLLLVLLFAKAIIIACGVIKSSVRALNKTWFIFFLPVIFAIFAVFHAAWSVSMTYLYYTSGKYDALRNMFSFVNYRDINGVMTPETDTVRVFYFVCMVFTVIWGFFIIYCSFEYIVSACVVQWYFSTDKKKRIKHILRNALVCYFKSFGTVLVTSFITSFVVLIRWFFEYIIRRLESTNKLADNKIIKAAVWFTRCCLHCLQKITEWINRNIQVCAAITGDGYFKSTGKTLRIMLGSMIKSIGVKILSKFFLFLGKLLISSSSGLLVFFLIRGTEQPEMIIAPIIIAVLGSFIISYYIMNIFSIVVDTIFFCYLYESTYMLLDRENGAESYAPKELVDIL